MQFASDYPDAEIWYEIYPEPNEIAVYEYFSKWWTALRHVYSWDGMNFTKPVAEFEGITTIMELFNEDHDNTDPVVFSKYALIDINEDGMPELLLSDDSEECQTVASIVDGQITLADSDFEGMPEWHPFR